MILASVAHCTEVVILGDKDSNEIASYGDLEGSKSFLFSPHLKLCYLEQVASFRHED